MKSCFMQEWHLSFFLFGYCNHTICDLSERSAFPGVYPDAILEKSKFELIEYNEIVQSDPAELLC
jgi:hypothetical protein